MFYPTHLLFSSANLLEVLETARRDLHLSHPVLKEKKVADAAKNKNVIKQNQESLRYAIGEQWGLFYTHLDWEIGRSVSHMVSPTERRILLPHVHLQMREEINIITGCECMQCSDATHHCSIHD